MLSAKISTGEELTKQGMLFQMADKFISDPLLIKKIGELLSMNKIGELFRRDIQIEIIKNGLNKSIDRRIIADMLNIDSSELDELIKEIQQEKTEK